jgi:uncharacterized membrane protein YkvA (DUF1232 family)
LDRRASQRLSASPQAVPGPAPGTVLSTGERDTPRMSTAQWLLLAAAVSLAIYLLFVAVLFAVGRRTAAVALARFIPDCIVLLRRLLGDSRVPRRRKVVLVALVGYLSMPIDLVPDFIPVAGQLDDVIIAAAALRYVLRSGGPDLLREHWPGPATSLNAVLRLAYGGGNSEAAPASDR